MLAPRGRPTQLVGAMLRFLVTGMLALLPVAVIAEPAAALLPASARSAKAQVVVIPVRDEIATPVFFVLRRGLKEAIENHADAVVLDMKTPGGALDVTFEIMEALGKFPGKSFTYVDDEALSAGAFVAATTDEIWFAPGGVIGAAAPVLSTGQDVDTTMKQKIVSYLKARVRATSEGKGHRGEVISAMIDADYELKIGEKVLKGKGELLSLTATEAMATYGDPPKPLLGAGVAPSIDELLTRKYGAGGYLVKTLEITWSERLASLLHRISPILLGLGLLAIYVEFKTPGFGIFGITGIVLLSLVFLGNYVAGLSGHEPILAFAVGFLLLALEIFFFPGVIAMAMTGLVLMIGSLIWSMADLWPNEPLTLSGDVFVQPIVNLGVGVSIAVVLAVALARFLPRGWIWDRLILSTAVNAAAQVAGASPGSAPEVASLVGRRGIAATALRPGGQVEIDGRRFEARVEVDAIDAGATIVVRGRTDFGLIVEKAES
jgi:membrane-bound serine protease (ClpP class)